MNIELSSGARFYEGIEKDLLELKGRLGLRYLCHNYFASPEDDFVVNLASLNDGIYQKSFQHLKNAIRVSKEIGAKKFGLHAGFFVDMSVRELNGTVRPGPLFDRVKCMRRFCDGFSILRSLSDGVELYIENNVYSSSNRALFKDDNPFMLTSWGDYAELRGRLDFKLLLDVAHLKVSARSLGLGFVDELEKMMDVADYVHLSEASDEHDQNKGLAADSPLVDWLKVHRALNGKTVTLEVYEDMEKIKESYNIISGLV